MSMPNGKLAPSGRLVPSDCLLFVCDLQESARGKVYELPTVVRGASTLVAAAQLLALPVVVTEQYPARFGRTFPEISDRLEGIKDAKVLDKLLLSMMTPEVDAFVASAAAGRRSVILCGIETHICVLQTCPELLDRGFAVHVVADAVSSSSSFNRSVGLERMRQAGAFITSVESVIFQLAKDAASPGFKGISKLIKQYLESKNGFDGVARL